MNAPEVVVTRTQRYMFDTAEDGEHQRLLENAQVWDRLTFRRLGELGVGEGWRCLEVGAGSGTVVRWLADRVGTTGHVVGTDLVTKWLRAFERPNFEALEHDLQVDPLGESVYDLINLRLVLVHQPDKQAALRKLIDALVPGGWLLVEDCDMRSLPVCHPPDGMWRTACEAAVRLLEMAGVDPYLGVELPGIVEDAGLLDVDAEAVAFPRRVPAIQPWRRQLVELRDRLVGAGLVTEAEIDGVIAKFDDPDCELVVNGPTMVSVYGRKPG